MFLFVAAYRSTKAGGAVKFYVQHAWFGGEHFWSRLRSHDDLAWLSLKTTHYRLKARPRRGINPAHMQSHQHRCDTLSNPLYLLSPFATTLLVPDTASLVM